MQTAERSRVELVLEALGIAYEVDEGKDGELKACCPFHADKKPSWGIRSEGEGAGIHHCFACKSGGNLLNLVMHVNKMGSFEADLWILTVAGVAPDEAPELAPNIVVKQRQAPGRLSFRVPDGVMFPPMERWPTPAKQELIRRGVTADQVIRWGLGYAVDGKLRGRVVIPVRDKLGRLATYQARDFTNGDDRPRYLTPSISKEHPRLDVMFGEQHWFHTKIVVVEGAFKALAVERAMMGWGYDVAALGGSDIRPTHVVKLMRYREVVVMTDPDMPGDKAAIELIGRIVVGTQECKVRRVRLKPGEEPDNVDQEYLRERLRH